jgi:hypothetical protein
MMLHNPINDIWQFFTANTVDYLAIGSWRFLPLALFWVLLIASIAIATKNWREDPSQRSGRVLGMAFARVLIGCMWFQGSLWKLPLPASEGLRYWTTQEATRAAFTLHQELIKNVVLPNLQRLGPFVYLAELTFATSLLLGFAVRGVGVLAIVFVLQLWLGIYQPGEPDEWPWTFMFLALLLFVFVIEAAGRDLGLDALLRRNYPVVRDSKGLIGRALQIVS